MLSARACGLSKLFVVTGGVSGAVCGWASAVVEFCTACGGETGCRRRSVVGVSQSVRKALRWWSPVLVLVAATVNWKVGGGVGVLLALLSCGGLVVG